MRLMQSSSRADASARRRGSACKSCQICLNIASYIRYIIIPSLQNRIAYSEGVPM